MMKNNDEKSSLLYRPMTKKVDSTSSFRSQWSSATLVDSGEEKDRHDRNQQRKKEILSGGSSVVNTKQISR
jgi:hypothetical protein